MVHITYYSAPVGQLLLAEEHDALIGLWFKCQKHYPTMLADSADVRRTQVLVRAEQWLDRYFAGSAPSSEELPLSPAGSAFQQKVWNELRQIPYGQTVTYGQIAAAIGTRSAQAVGGAVGRNPISIIIPCHRIVGAGGSLTGYAAGLEKKRFLLSHEGVDLSCYPL